MMNAKMMAHVLGAIFVLVGVLGFLPNPLVGADSLFVTDALHNLVHLVTGILFFVAAKMGRPTCFMCAFGVVYLVVAALGFVLSGGAEDFHLLGLIHMNALDNWLHLVLGLGILGLGLYYKKH